MVENGTLTVESVVLDPKVTVVAEAIVKQVLKALTDAKTEISQKTVMKVAQAVEGTIKTLVDSGVISVNNVHLVTSVNATDISEITGVDETSGTIKEEIEEVSNTQLENVATQVAFNDNVTAKLTQTVAELKFDKNSLNATEYIYRIFGELIEATNGTKKVKVPTFIKDFFVDLYENGTKIKVRNILTYFKNGVSCFSKKQSY
jgi:hypothetical protein